MTAAELLYEAETDIMLNMIEFLRLGKIEDANWQQEKLKDFGALNAKNKKIIAKYGKQITNATLAEIKEAAEEAIKAIEPQFLSAIKKGATLPEALPANASPALRNVLEIYQKRAVDGMNFTMQTMLKNAGTTYMQTANKASLLVLSGATSPDQAIAQTVREWSKSGIPSIIDSAERRWSTEAYAQTLLRSTVRGVTTDTQFERCDEYGTDLIEISSHLDARPGCSPYQGKVYSRNGKTKGYPNFGNTSYGDAAGILGINCRHTITPFFEGISTRTYEEDPNTKRAYKDSQTQRRYERDIRKSKREVKMFKKMPEQARAKATLKAREKRLKGFLTKSGRTRRSNRERIYDVL